MNINEKLYKTKDIFIASTLYALGIKIQGTEWINNECFFIFKNEDKCKKIITKYYSDDLSLNPRLLFDSFKTIKSILYQNRTKSDKYGI